MDEESWKRRYGGAVEDRDTFRARLHEARAEIQRLSDEIEGLHQVIEHMHEAQDCARRIIERHPMLIATPVLQELREALK